MQISDAKQPPLLRLSKICRKIKAQKVMLLLCGSSLHIMAE